MSVRMTAAGRYGWVSDRKGYRYEPRHPSGGLAADPGVGSGGVARGQPGVDRDPQCCLVNFYGEGAKMGLHQDRDEADFDMPVVSISLGDDALFRVVGVERGAADTVGLAALGRRGGDGRRRRGCLSRDRPGPRWASSTLLRRGGRINLTLRVVD
jgi:alkylated DNA repair protein (DNA oxidative demethylase)